MPNVFQPVYANVNKDLKEMGIIVAQVSFMPCFEFTEVMDVLLLLLLRGKDTSD